MALAIYDRGICDCGYHSSLTSDPTNAFAIESRNCNVCGALDRYHRVQREADEEHERRLGGDRMPADRARPGDGRKISVRRTGTAV